MAHSVQEYLTQSNAAFEANKSKINRFTEAISTLDEKSHEPNSSLTPQQVTNVLGHMINAHSHIQEFYTDSRQRGVDAVFPRGATHLYKTAGMFVGMHDPEYGEIFTQIGSLMSVAGWNEVIQAVRQEKEIAKGPTTRSMHLYRQFGKFADAFAGGYQNAESLRPDTMIGFPMHGTPFRAGQIANWLLNTPPQVGLGT